MEVSCDQIRRSRDHKHRIIDDTRNTSCGAEWRVTWAIQDIVDAVILRHPTLNPRPSEQETHQQARQRKR